MNASYSPSRRDLLNVSATLLIAQIVQGTAVSAADVDWPTQPVTLVVPAPPGGNIDIAARLVAKELATTFGQPFIIENKAGAGGKIAAEYVKTAGRSHVVLFSANLFLFSPLILGGPTYDWQADFVPVGSVSFTPMVLAVHPKTPANNVRELLDLARNQKGSLIMASPGIGTSNHLVSEMLQARAGVKWTTVQYRGNAPATTDLIAGVVQFQFDQISSSLPHIKNGSLRPIAVTSRKRVSSLPDVPTFEEQGFSGFEAETFTGMFAPASSSRDVVNKLSAALRKIVDEKSTAERLATFGSEARSMSPDEFRVYLADIYKVWVPVIKSANISGG